MSMSARAFEKLEQRLYKVRSADHFKVREVQGRPRAACDLHHLVHRLKHPVRFVAHVRNERHAEGRGLPGQLDQFLGLRKGARHVDQPE
jgi:hypothetical protein